MIGKKTNTNTNTKKSVITRSDSGLQFRHLCGGIHKVIVTINLFVHITNQVLMVSKNLKEVTNR